MRAAIAFLLALLFSATAFVAPGVGRRASTAVLHMGYEKEIGAQAPLGFWDPLGILNDAPKETFDRLRTTEVKHGRIAMLAILGHLVTGAGIRLPGHISYALTFDQIPAGLKAFSVIPPAGIAQLVGFIGLAEIGYSTVAAKIEERSIFNSKWDAKTIEKKKAIELNNGRAAQMGILGMMVHEVLNNDPYVLNTLLGAHVDFNQGF